MDIKKLIAENTAIAEMAQGRELFWLNPGAKRLGDVALDEAGLGLPFTMADIDEAEARLARFAPYIARVFPETAAAGGVIESPLTAVPRMKGALAAARGPVRGSLYLKRDSDLPISGSVKARGGIYEVLKFAEEVATSKGLLSPTDDYARLAGEDFRRLFSEYSVAVGSTGNLGLSIGIISAKLGFKVTVHMSADARQWKKDLLRAKGVTVIEYPDDYQKAVAEGRREAAGVTVDSEHPLFVYIPCGVGGAPGGITFGLKEIFGDNVHVFFAEPTHAPCMSLGLMSGLHDGISVRDIGLDGLTAADGLAVSRPSRLVGTIMEPLLAGCYTSEDEALYPFLAMLADSEGLYVEPSACASFAGPSLVTGAGDYLAARGLTDKMDNACHILWATGGSMVPAAEMDGYYQKGLIRAATWQDKKFSYSL